MQFYGSEHNALLDWLGTRWIESGPPVCLVTGFPGVGKTRLSHELQDRLDQSTNPLRDRFARKVAVIELPESAWSSPVDFLLKLSGELSRLGCSGLEQRLQAGEEIDRIKAFAVSELLSQPLVILDEWQRCLDDQGKPHRFFVELFRQFTSHRTTRLLALANRHSGDSTALEGIERRSLSGLKTDDGGMSLLVTALGTQSDSVPVERRGDVVQWMQGNPRALEMVAAALQSATLDDLIGLAPDVWETREREVDPGLLARLHERIVAKVVGGLPDEAAEFLRALSVHRQAIDNEAIKALLPDVGRRLTCQRTLVERHLLQTRTKWFRVQELAAEVIRRQLAEDRAAYILAHQAAGKYHSRHFTAKRVVIVPGMGEHFLEARYHFTQAEDAAELAAVVEPFRAYLQNQCSLITPPPKDARERDERIVTLLALLSDQKRGDEALNFHLARCLTARSTLDDRRRALDHLQRTTLHHDAPWIMRLHLEAELESCDVFRATVTEALKSLPTDDKVYVAAAEGLVKHDLLSAAVQLLKGGIKVVPVGSAFPLYTLAAQLLARDGKLSEAVQLLKDGIQVVPPDKNLFALYMLAAELMARDGPLSEAVQLLKDGIQVVPPDKNLLALHTLAAGLLARDGQLLECWNMCREGLRRIPVGQLGRTSLEAAYLRSCVMVGDVGELKATIAAKGEERLSDGGQRIGESYCLAFDDRCHDAAERLVPDRRILVSRMLEAFWRVMAGEADIAAELVYANDIEHDQRNAWLMCLVELRRGRESAARGHFQRLIQPAADGTRIVPEGAIELSPDTPVTMHDLLRVWNGPILGNEHPAILLPLLPPALTGLPHVVCRPVDRSPAPEITKLLEPIPAPTPHGLKAVFRLQGERWNVAWNGGEAKSIDAVHGMTYLHRLLQQPDRLIRVDVLLQEPLPDNEFVRQTKIDGKGLKKLKDHIKHLNKQLEKIGANRLGGPDLSVEAGEELDEQSRKTLAEREELERHVASVTGPDGKPKREGTAADKQSARAREAIKTALQKLHQHCPEMAEHLDHCQSSDAFQFCYRPAATVDWED